MSIENEPNVFGSPTVFNYFVKLLLKHFKKRMKYTYIIEFILQVWWVSEYYNLIKKN